MIYDTTMTAIAAAPKDRQVALIIRHSARYPIVDEQSVYTAGLTPEGVKLAIEFGEKVAAMRPIRHIVTNFVGRCQDTAEAIAKGAGHFEGVTVNARLSHPFIEPVWESLPISWPNTPPPSQLLAVLSLVVTPKDEPGVIDIYVTHDTIVGVVAGYLMGEVFATVNWPGYLEGILIWKDGEKVCAHWRGEMREFTGLFAVRSPK